MGLFRLLLLLAIAWAIYAIVRRVREVRRQRIARRPRPEVRRMVRCHTCGVHIPEGEALQEGEDWYCSEAHRRGEGR